jgi:hypothetical protein
MILLKGFLGGSVVALIVLCLQSGAPYVPASAAGNTAAPRTAEDRVLDRLRQVKADIDLNGASARDRPRRQP